MEQETVKQLEQLISSQDSLRWIVGIMAIIITGLFTVNILFVKSFIKNFISNFNSTTNKITNSINNLTEVTQDLVISATKSNIESEKMKEALANLQLKQIKQSTSLQSLGENCIRFESTIRDCDRNSNNIVDLYEKHNSLNKEISDFIIKQNHQKNNNK